jgi:formamidopyrimidine-DNA glycosylase
MGVSAVPELPDIVVYIEALESRIRGQVLDKIRVVSPFLLRTTDPPLAAAEGKRVRELRRVGKRIAIGLGAGSSAGESSAGEWGAGEWSAGEWSAGESRAGPPGSGESGQDDLWLVLHLMIAGRLHWQKLGAKVARPRGLAAFDFSNGTLVWTEAGSKKRASLHVARGEAGLSALDPGGLEVLEAGLDRFAAALTSENHTLKRCLTDPRLFSGIGNAYSDEILFEAGLSPLALTQKLKPAEIERLFLAVRTTLTRWVEELRTEAAGEFPEKVTAFRANMAVHGRYKDPCVRCGAKIQRIRYADNETDYCPHCQTNGKLLADRALSRLLREDWPQTPVELELRIQKP